MARPSDSFWFSLKGLAAAGLIVAVSYFLLMEHRQHVFEFLPWLFLLLCPLMHIFMHHGHKGHGKQQHTSAGNDKPYDSVERDRKNNHHH